MDTQTQHQNTLPLILAVLALAISLFSLYQTFAMPMVQAPVASDIPPGEAGSETAISFTSQYHQENRVFEGIIESISGDTITVRTNIYDATRAPNVSDTANPDLFLLRDSVTTEVSLSVRVDTQTEFPLKEKSAFTVGDRVRFVSTQPVSTQTQDVQAQYFYNVVPGL